MFSTGARAAGIGSTTLPSGSLYASAAVRPTIVEIGVFNTSATTVFVMLNRLTTAGTQGAGLTEDDMDANGATAAATAFNTHTVAPTLGNQTGHRAVLAGLSGVIWTFGPRGLAVPVGTGNGVGIIIATGTGQALDFWFVWSE